MSWFLSNMPWWFGLLGILLGSWMNFLIDRLAWEPRNLSPYAPAQAGVRRRAIHFVPVIGWLTRTGESQHLGRRFWIAPLITELMSGGLFAAFYYLHAMTFRMAGYPLEGPATQLWTLAAWNETMWPRLGAELLLICLMTVASWIDIREKTIPDSITVPGTLAGLTLAAWQPWSQLSASYYPFSRQTDFLQLASPNDWPEWLQLGHGTGLALAIACWIGWCFGLLDRRWITRKGWRRACIYFWARLWRRITTYWLLALMSIGLVVLFAIKNRLGEASQAALLSSLLGVAVGGGIVWGVRLVASAALHREAMGFGDVTLMAMIGAFVGWQNCLVIFFLAPLAGLVMAIMQWLCTGQQDIYYGPFLCLATLGLLGWWQEIWDYCRPMFAMTGLVPTVMAVSLVLMGLLLWIWQRIKLAMLSSEPAE